MREQAGNEIKALMVNKFKEGTEPYIIMMRDAEDGVTAWGRALRWLTETTGAALNQLTHDIMYPEPAKTDADVLRRVEQWLSDYEEATAKGMNPLGPMQKASVIRRIVTDRYKERIDTRSITNDAEGTVELDKLIVEIRR